VSLPQFLALPDEAATARLGAALGRALLEHATAIAQHGLNLRFTGELGAGKTALVRACLRAAGVQGPVKSPTFTLLEPYKVSSLDFYHFDFYRFASPAEFASAGFREHFGPGCITAVEWPDKAGPRLPPADLDIELLSDGAAGRVARIRAPSDIGQACWISAMHHWTATADAS
jgi:tRNA threonylcarbamoyladenosine biosynthesis protein TsaE